MFTAREKYCGLIVGSDIINLIVKHTHSDEQWAVAKLSNQLSSPLLLSLVSELFSKQKFSWKIRKILKRVNHSSFKSETSTTTSESCEIYKIRSAIFYSLSVFYSSTFRGAPQNISLWKILFLINKVEKFVSIIKKQVGEEMLRKRNVAEICCF